MWLGGGGGAFWMEKGMCPTAKFSIVPSTVVEFMYCFRTVISQQVLNHVSPSLY